MTCQAKAAELGQTVAFDYVMLEKRLAYMEMTT